jgi:anti-sigma factor RsiW
MTRPKSEELEAYLAAAFYRRSCPSPDELGEYQLGLLDRKRTAAITRHLAECPHCARELAQLRSFLGDLAPEPQLDQVEVARERVRVVVARLVGGARDLLRPQQSAFEPIPVGVRGSDEGPARYEAEDVEIIASPQPNAEEPDRLTLHCLVAGIDPAGWTAHLWQSGALVAVASIDEVGNFSVSGLAPGSCELVLAGPDREIYIEELTL